MSIFQRAQFLKSAAKLSQLPEDYGFEVAFAGRSNAGKSSALNCLTLNKSLARTSKTPGRTQLINLFTLDETRRLVNLPGYGFAKVPLEVKLRWQNTLAQYLEGRNCLKGLVLLMDIRHPLKELDEMMLHWSIAQKLPCHILLTKADKISYGAAKQVVNDIKQRYILCQELVSVQSFSSLKGTGLLCLEQKLEDWFGYTEQEKPSPTKAN